MVRRKTPQTQYLKSACHRHSLKIGCMLIPQLCFVSFSTIYLLTALDEYVSRLLFQTVPTTSPITPHVSPKDSSSMSSTKQGDVCVYVCVCDRD
jgi:hypothetical protein